MLSADGLIDGSFDVTIHVTDCKLDKTIRARGDVHIGGLMIRIVNALDSGPFDWSDHAIWWPAKNTWLLRTRRTLDQYDVPAGAVLWFTPMHKQIRINFPNLQVLDERVNFSANVFNNIISICKKYGIRHPEELSLLRAHDVLQSAQKSTKARPVSYSANPASLNTGSSTGRLDTAGVDTATADVMLGRSMTNLFDANELSSGYGSYGSGDEMSNVGQLTLAHSPGVMACSASTLNVSFRPKSYSDKAKVNSRWLDSSRSLMEQGITSDDTVFMRYKYSTFFDLNPKYDALRISQIYQQARWSLITETVHCTDEEMILFAALQLHIKRHQTDTDDSSVKPCSADEANSEDADDVDAALNELQSSLEGRNNEHKSTNVAQYPELKDYHMFLKPRKMTMNRYKRRYCVFKDTTLSVFRKDGENDSPLTCLYVKGCVVRGEADVASGKFLIRVTTLPTSSEPSVEVFLSQDNLEKHGIWLAALHTASRRHTMANVTFTTELESVLNLLSLRQSKSSSRQALHSAGDLTTDELDEYVAERVLRKMKRQQIVARMLVIAENLREMSATAAKLTFIKVWQSLPDAAHAYFVVSFKGSTKKELIAVGVERLLHLDLTTGQCLRAWPYDKMRSWAVNWNTEQLKIELEQQNDADIAFNCLGADCKVVHEYIGGYVFLAMRSMNKTQTLDEQLFQKLTGGRQ